MENTIRVNKCLYLLIRLEYLSIFRLYEILDDLKLNNLLVFVDL